MTPKPMQFTQVCARGVVSSDVSLFSHSKPVVKAFKRRTSCRFWSILYAGGRKSRSGSVRAAPVARPKVRSSASEQMLSLYESESKVLDSAGVEATPGADAPQVVEH